MVGVFFKTGRKSVLLLTSESYWIMKHLYQAFVSHQAQNGLQNHLGTDCAVCNEDAWRCKIQCNLPPHFLTSADLYNTSEKYLPSSIQKRMPLRSHCHVALPDWKKTDAPRVPINNYEIHKPYIFSLDRYKMLFQKDSLWRQMPLKCCQHRR